MRRLISGLAAIVLAASASQAAPLTNGGTLRIAVQPGTQYAALYIAKEKKWLEQEFRADGISVTFSDFRSGPAMLESFASGGQDIGVIGDTPAIIGRAAGIRVKVISVIGAGAKRVAVVIPGKSGIASVSELKGLRVGTPKGTPAHQFLAVALQANKVPLENIKLINLPYADSIVALASGDVDAVSLVEPYISDAEVRGLGRQLIDGEGLVLGTSVVLANDIFARDNPEIVARILRVLERANDWLRQNPQEAVKILSKETKFSEAALSKALPKITTDQRITPDVRADLKKTIGFLHEQKLIKNEVDPDALLTSLIDESHLVRAGIR